MKMEMARVNRCESILEEFEAQSRGDPTIHLPFLQHDHPCNMSSRTSSFMADGCYVTDQEFDFLSLPQPNHMSNTRLAFEFRQMCVYLG